MPWRSLSGDADRVEPRPLSVSLSRLAASLGAPPPGVLSVVFSGWERIVGADVAAHARPVTLRDGVLVIAVDQPAWATELNHLKVDLLRRIGEATASAEVTEVRVRVSPPGTGREGRNRRDR